MLVGFLCRSGGDVPLSVTTPAQWPFGCLQPSNPPAHNTSSTMLAASDVSVNVSYFGLPASTQLFYVNEGAA